MNFEDLEWEDVEETQPKYLLCKIGSVPIFLTSVSEHNDVNFKIKIYGKEETYLIPKNKLINLNENEIWNISVGFKEIRCYENGKRNFSSLPDDVRKNTITDIKEFIENYECRF